MTAKRCVVAVVCAVLLAASAAAQCVSTLIPVSQPLVFPSHAAGPIAWNGSLLGMAKQDADRFHNPIWFAVYDGNLNQVGGDVNVAVASADGPRLLLWNGSEFALFYLTTSFQIVFQRIGTNGNPIGDPIPVVPSHPPFTGQEFDAVWDATRNAYIVVRTIPIGFERGLWLSVVGPDGAVKSDQIITSFTLDPAYPRVAVTPSGVIGIMWSRTVNNGQQDVPELAFGIAVPGPGLSTLASAGANGASPALATDGHLFFIVYRAPGGSGTTVLRSLKFDTAGRIAAADQPLLSGGTDVVPFSMIANVGRSEWALLYLEFSAGVQSVVGGETRLRLIPFSSGVTTDGPLPSDTSKTTLPPQSRLVWNGTAYLASIGRFLTIADGTESYVVRNCPLTVTATATPNVTSLFVPVTLSAQASGGLGPYTFAWTFGDLGSGSGQTLTHVYTQLGTYTATVTVTDANHSTVSTTVTVTIANLRRRPSKH
jgi:hypothetical protein